MPELDYRAGCEMTSSVAKKMPTDSIILFAMIHFSSALVR
jgi:hypothetical protein